METNKDQVPVFDGTEWVQLGDNPRGGRARVIGNTISVFDGGAYEPVRLTIDEAIKLGDMARAYKARQEASNDV